MALPYELDKARQRWFTDDYTRMFLSLLPKGFIWVGREMTLGRWIQDVVDGEDEAWDDTIDSATEYQDVVEVDGEGDLLTRILSCFASEWARIEKEAWRALNEGDPGVATDTLTTWERNLGLPGECFANLLQTVEERQTQAHLKRFAMGDTTTLSWYEDLATSLGFDVTITEVPVATTPRIMGVAIMGAQPMGGIGGFSIFDVHINSGPTEDAPLRCMFNAVKQAHVVITLDGATWE